MAKITTDRLIRKKRRGRGGVFGTKDMPKISVFRSNKYLYAQAIDDEKRETVVSASSCGKSSGKVTKLNQSKEVGKELAQKLLKKGIKQAVFNRGPYVYLGRVKAFVEGLREGGLKI